MNISMSSTPRRLFVHNSATMQFLWQVAVHRASDLVALCRTDHAANSFDHIIRSSRCVLHSIRRLCTSGFQARQVDGNQKDAQLQSRHVLSERSLGRWECCNATKGMDAEGLFSTSSNLTLKLLSKSRESGLFDEHRHVWRKSRRDHRPKDWKDLELDTSQYN